MEPNTIKKPSKSLSRLADAWHRVAERVGRWAAGSVAGRWFGLLQCQLVLAQHEAAVAMQGARVAPVGVAALPFVGAAAEACVCL